MAGVALLDDEIIRTMTRRDIQLMQEKIGVTPDGFWGPVSIKACQDHLRKMAALPNHWPAQD